VNEGCEVSNDDEVNTLETCSRNLHTMSDHVAAVCHAGSYRLRQLRPTVKSLPADAAKTLIQAFISNCLDYYNAALFGITDSLTPFSGSFNQFRTLNTHMRAHLTSPHATLLVTCQPSN